MNKERVKRILEIWAMGEYRRPYFLAEPQNKCTKEEFRRLENICYEYEKEIDEIYQRKLYSRRKLEEEHTKMKQLLKDITQMSACQVQDHFFVINRTLKEMGEV